MKIITNILIIVATINVIIQISFLEISLGFAYYGIMFSILLLLFLIGRRYKLNFYMIWLVFAGYLSILFNNIPSFFQSTQRFLSFVIVISLIGPLVENSALKIFRVKLLNTFNLSILILVLFSFIGILLGTSIVIGRGGFAGFFNHSMMLGPLAGIAIIVAIHKANTTIHRRNWVYYGLAAISFVTCVAAGSRSAVMAGILGTLFYFYKVNQGKITRFFGIMVVLIAFSLLSFPLWEPYTERIWNKMAYAEEQGDLLVTRVSIWQIRVKEFLSSPIFGVGFASVDTSIINNRFDSTKGTVEPGSSWLTVLSMTGLIGFIPLLILTWQYLSYLVRDKGDPKNHALLGGILLLFIIHMMAEGYILSAGSGLFFYYWLTMGNIEIYKKQGQVK